MFTVYIGADHAGFILKESLKKYLTEREVLYVDLGCFSEDPVDYPDVAREVAEKVFEHRDENAKGILICGTGLGVCMAANKYRGIRAAAAMTEEMVELARRHNDANIACLGGRLLNMEQAQRIVSVFLNTPFEKEERHVRRIKKIEDMETK